MLSEYNIINTPNFTLKLSISRENKYSPAPQMAIGPCYYIYKILLDVELVYEVSEGNTCSVI